MFQSLSRDGVVLGKFFCDLSDEANLFQSLSRDGVVLGSSWRLLSATYHEVSIPQSGWGGFRHDWIGFNIAVILVSIPQSGWGGFRPHESKYIQKPPEKFQSLSRDGVVLGMNKQVRHLFANSFNPSVGMGWF